MNATIEQRLRLLEQGARQHNHTGGAIADLVVLRAREVDEQLCNLVTHVHLLEDRRAVVRDGYVTIGRAEHLVHPLWAKRRAQHVAHALRRLCAGQEGGGRTRQ